MIDWATIWYYYLLGSILITKYSCVIEKQNVRKSDQIFRYPGILSEFRTL